ncbi:transporter substrate-binding domain-containing protein [Roseomonas harenae]|uniref:transporter substrate-binding domain-containing protein n=1 Tax=Muricoccus harenae TaxID=2692566 RepID=UPI00133137D5|nr:transporter substrate-binding domain-containing protein [Roseomonas harenae]
MSQARNALHDLAPTGRLRATINLGNPVLAQRNAATGELGGVSADLARALARQIGVEAELHPFDRAGAAFAALRDGVCDVGFLAIDPERATKLDFTAAYVVIEGTYLVPADSAFDTVEAVDSPGVRIAAGKNSAYDLHLSRSLRHAKLVHAPGLKDAISLLTDGRVDVVAGVRQPLVATAAGQPGFRVLEGRFMEIRQAMTLPKGRPVGAALLHGFVEAMKESGFVADALARSGQGEATVAPPG